MKKKFVLIFILVLTIFLGWNRVEAEVTSYSESSEAINSKQCVGEDNNRACISSAWHKIGEIYTDLYGARVSIVDENNKVKYGPTNFWATKAMKDQIDNLQLVNDMSYSNVFIEGTGMPPNFVIDGSSTSYSTYIQNMSESNVRVYLNYFKKDIEDVKNYYLKIEPIYVLQFLCDKGNVSGVGDSCKNKVYYFGGTSKEILISITQLPSDYSHSYYAKYIINNDENWNIIRSYITTTYIKKSPNGSQIPYFSGKISSDNKTLYGQYKKDDSGLGVGYVEISDYVPKKGHLIINKINSQTGTKISGAKFKLYKGYGCSGSSIGEGSTNQYGILRFNNLVLGQYSVYESEIPDGYISTNRCTNVDVLLPSVEVTKTIKNTPQKGNITIIKKDSITKKVIEGVGFKLYKGEGCSAGGTELSNYKTRTTDRSGKITYEDLSPGEYSVYESGILDSYLTPTNRCTNITVSAGQTTTEEITNTPKGSLKIIKTNSGNDALKDVGGSTRFKLYTGITADGECTGTSISATVNSRGIANFSNLNPVTYYLKEYQAKTGYHRPTKGEAWYCSPVVITAGQTEEITIHNQTECEYKFNSSMTMRERIDLFNEIKRDYGLDFNALLNMENDDAREACRNIPVEKNYDKRCLGCQSKSTDSGTFSKTNVSMYTEKHGQYTFCLTNFSMKNNMRNENATEMNNFSTIKSGQNIIGREAISTIPFAPNYNMSNYFDIMALSTGTLTRVCYNYGDSTNPADLEYDNYVGDVILNEIRMIESTTTKVDKKADNSITIKKEGLQGEEAVSFNLYKYKNCANGDTDGLYPFGLAGGIYKDIAIHNNETLTFENLPLGNGGYYSVFERSIYGSLEEETDTDYDTMPYLKSGNVKILIPSFNIVMAGDRCTNIFLEEIDPEVEKTETVIKVGYFLPYMYASNNDGRISYGYCPTGKYCKKLGRGIISKLNETPGTYNLNFEINLNEQMLGDLDQSSDCQYTVENELITKDNDVELTFRTLSTDSLKSFLNKGTGEIRTKIGSNWKSLEVREQVLNNRNDSYDKTSEGYKYKIKLTPAEIKAIREYNMKTPYDDYTLYCEDDGYNCNSKFLDGLQSGTLELIETGDSWIIQNKLLIK